MRPIAPFLPHGAFLSHRQLQEIAQLNAQLDQIEKAHARLESQLRRGVPLDPTISGHVVVFPQGGR